MTLFINACVRAESRTKRLALHLLSRLGDYEEADLSNMDLKPLDRARLEKRTDLLSAGDYSDTMFDLAKQFAAADRIVIAAPYWDDSFPAILKIYLENIYVTGIVSHYGSDGRPVGLCKASELDYITTAGGPYCPDYSYAYLSRMAQECFGIRQTRLIQAEMLDVDGYDPEEILRRAEAQIDSLFPENNLKNEQRSS